MPLPTPVVLSGEGPEVAVVRVTACRRTHHATANAAAKETTHQADGGQSGGSTDTNCSCQWPETSKGESSACRGSGHQSTRSSATRGSARSWSASASETNATGINSHQNATTESTETTESSGSGATTDTANRCRGSAESVTTRDATSDSCAKTSTIGRRDNNESTSTGDSTHSSGASDASSKWWNWPSISHANDPTLRFSLSHQSGHLWSGGSHMPVIDISQRDSVGQAAVGRTRATAKNVAASPRQILLIHVVVRSDDDPPVVVSPGEQKPSMPLIGKSDVSHQDLMTRQ